jgi:NMD protein affecting ribosome stability and mRNA decay
MAKCIVCGLESHKESSSLCESCLKEKLMVELDRVESKWF